MPAHLSISFNQTVRTQGPTSVMGRFPSSSIINGSLSRHSIVALAWCRGSFSVAVRSRVRRGGGCPRRTGACLNVLCPSPGFRFCPWSAHRLPTSYPVQIGSRVPISTACSNATYRFGKRVGPRASSGTASRRGDVGGSPTFRRGSFLLSSLTTDGMQPRLCRPKRHRLFAREAELGAVPPHPVKHYADAPSQGHGGALLAPVLRQP